MLMITGSGRSGTTWLGKLFDSHPDVLYLHEPDSVLRKNDLPFLPRPVDIARRQEDAAEYLNALAQVRSPKVVSQLPLFDKAYRSAAGAKIHQGMTWLGKMAVRLPRVSERSVNVPDMIAPGGAPVTVMKSVIATCRMPLFAAAAPDMRFIHLIRHPCAVVASRKRGAEQGLIDAHAWLNALFRQPEARLYPFTLAEMNERPLLQRLAYSWMVHNDKAAADMEGHSRYRAVIYEKLARDPMGETQDLFAFAGLDWAAQTQGFIDALEAATGEGTYFSVIQSPRHALDRWRKTLTEEEVAQIMEIVAHARMPVVRETAAC